MEERLAEAARLGFRRAIVPATGGPLDSPGLLAIRVRTLAEALAAALEGDGQGFGRQKSQPTRPQSRAVAGGRDDPVPNPIR